MHYGYLFALIGLIVCGPALAEGDHSHGRDHDRARRAVEEGRILPLKDILDRALSDYPGQMIEAELEGEDGQLVYDITILTVDGHVIKLLFDPQTGELLKAKGRDGRR